MANSKTIPESSIQDYLDLLKSKIKADKDILKIQSDRQENLVFAYLYGITKEYIRNVLLELKIDDFIEITENVNPNFPKNPLYVFGPIVSLNDALGNKRDIQLYIKIDICGRNNNVVVISFHEAKFKYGEK